ncbi:hypothetical protein T492DRAFT_414763 [Pavlovales sp. CCMP2436]|nr:hypothetical protein T492DRAFT_414763 [Pavlovales sp. CCMP2436]
MAEGGWAKVVDYYQNKETKEWVPYSTQHEPPGLAPHAKPSGKFNALSFALAFDARTPGLAPGAAGQALISPWHHISLSAATPGSFNMVVEIRLGNHRWKGQKEVAGIHFIFIYF